MFGVQRIIPRSGPTWKTQPFGLGWSQGEAVSPRVPKIALMRKRTVPSRPSMRRASSLQGRRPAKLLFRDSVTRARPSGVAISVSRMLLSGR